MSKVVNFPNGFEVTILDKEDILKTIDDNIVDKEVLKEIIDNLEDDMKNFISQNRWTGVPYLGNVRVPKYVQMINSEEAKTVIQDAKENLDLAKYAVFRKNLGVYIHAQIKNDRFYNYTVSINVRRYDAYYRLIRLCGNDKKCRFYMFSVSQLTYLPGNVTYEER